MSTTIGALENELDLTKKELYRVIGTYDLDGKGQYREAYEEYPRYPSYQKDRTTITPQSGSYASYKYTSLVQTDHFASKIDERIAKYKEYLFDNLQALSTLTHTNGTEEARKFLAHRTSELNKWIDNCKIDKSSLEWNIRRLQSDKSGLEEKIASLEIAIDRLR